MFSVFRTEVSRLFGQPESKIAIQEVVKILRETEQLVNASLGKEFMIELESVIDGIFSRSNEVPLRLSEFLDEGIRKGPASSRFDDALLVFKYLRSKDVFEAYYRFHLGRRVLSSSSFDMEIERDFMNRLRQECGQSYVAKIEAMLNDVDNSRELVSSWRAETRAEICDFFHQPLILSTSVWSHVKLVNPRLVLPGIMRESLEVFASFYSSKFAGRKLTWVHSQGSAEVKHISANCLLTVSTIQAVILDQLNHSDFVSIDSISKKTNLAVDDLKRHLLSLHVNPKCPVLKKKESEDALIVNMSFEPKSRHMKIPLIVDSSAISMPELTGDTDTGIGIERVVEEDRKHLIEAAIVRIMKSKRQLDHNNLIVEITKHLENRFVPSVQVIKEKVENLIDREYIARDNDDVKLYYYVA
jgi:cullin 3